MIVNGLHFAWASFTCFFFFKKKKANGYDQKFSKNTGFNTVPAATSANNDRTHRCIRYAQVLQDWNTFRWARISLLCDPAAKIDQDESPRVLRFHIVRRSLESMFVPHDLQYCCPIFWIDVDLSGNKLAAREVRSFSTYYEVLYHSNQEACSGILEQQANSRIFWREEHLLVNIQRHWLEKGNTEICLHNATEVGAFASQDTGASRCPRPGNTWWNGNSNEPLRTLDLVALRMVDMFERHTSRHFQRRSHYRLDFWGKEEELTISKVHSKTIRF